MMTEKLQQVLNEQVTAELWSANLSFINVFLS